MLLSPELLLRKPTLVLARAEVFITQQGRLSDILKIGLFIYVFIAMF